VTSDLLACLEIVSAAAYVVGCCTWAAVSTTRWMDSGEGTRERVDRARMVLVTPLWFLWVAPWGFRIFREVVSDAFRASRVNK
jgi:hypothetical protein